MFSLEMGTEHEVFVSGCKGILAYTDMGILLDMGSFALRVDGKDVSMLSYVNGEMYIEGGIESIEFEQKSEAFVNEDKH